MLGKNVKNILVTISFMYQYSKYKNYIRERKKSTRKLSIKVKRRGRSMNYLKINISIGVNRIMTSKRTKVINLMKGKIVHSYYA